MSDNNKKSDLKPLSRKQTQILRLYAADLTTKEIVAKLKTTRSAVKRHREAILRKFAVHSLHAAIQVFNDLARKAA